MEVDHALKVRILVGSGRYGTYCHCTRSAYMENSNIWTLVQLSNRDLRYFLAVDRSTSFTLLPDLMAPFRLGFGLSQFK